MSRSILRVAPYCDGCNTHHTRRCDVQQRINRWRTAIGMASLYAASIILGVAIGVQW